MKKRNLLLCAAIILFSVTAFSSVEVAGILRDYNSSRDAYSHLIAQTVTRNSGDPENIDCLTIDHAALLAINSDYVGWLEIPGTDISYPLLLGKNNSDYLRATFEGAFATAGSIFLDFWNTGHFDDYNTVIYGHHMRDGSMFAPLANYMREEYCRKNTEIRIYIPNGNILRYNIFSAYRATTESECFTFEFAQETAFKAWTDRMEKSSWYDFGVDVASAEHIITLVTCTGRDIELRYVLQAVLVEEKAAEAQIIPKSHANHS